MAKRPRPIILTVLDGWGYRAESAGNAIALARKPNYDELLRKFPNTLIHTSGKYVGLPDGQMGNSEVGHLNIGAGRIVHMDSTKLDLMILNGELFKNSVLLDAMARGRTRQLHLMGLLSDGGVHSHIDHLFALLKMAREQKVERVFVHCFMDGRDTPPHSGAEFLAQLQHSMQEFHIGQIASVTGRYYAMDRDNRWERIERAYRAMVHGDAPVRVVDPDHRRARQLRTRHHRRIHRANCGNETRRRWRIRQRRTRRHHSRRRLRHLLQFPRRSRPSNDPRPFRTGLRQILPTHRARRIFSSPASPNTTKLSPG